MTFGNGIQKLFLLPDAETGEDGAQHVVGENLAGDEPQMVYGGMDIDREEVAGEVACHTLGDTCQVVFYQT